MSLLIDAHTTTDFEFAGKNVSAEVLVDDLNASFYENDLPGRKADAMKVEQAFA